MENIDVFDNESIWIFQQMFESLYTVSPDGKSVKPWLATSYDLSADQKTYTFHLRQGVKFHNGQPMTSADVKFSIDKAKDPKTGWGFIDSAIKTVEAPDPSTVVITTKYKWAPLSGRHRAVQQRGAAQGLRRHDPEAVLRAPDRHRPVQVGSLDARPGDQAGQEPRLLAEGQALPEQRHLDDGAAGRHP